MLALTAPLCWADTVAAAYNAGTTGTAPDPVMEGWTAGVPTTDTANFASESVSPDGSTGFNAWRMLDNSTAGSQFITWTKNLTDEEHQNAYANGWNLKTRIRVADPVAANGGSNSVVLLYGNNAQGPVGTARRFILFLDVNASGVLVASLAGGSTVTLTGVDPAQHHVHEFNFDAVTKQATYLVDGVSKATGYAGTTGTFNGIQWGTGSSGGRGDGYWNEVTFTIRNAPSAPVLATSPAGGSFKVGDSITLTGSFTGVVTTYEWLKNGELVPNQTTATLSIPFARATDAGSYVLRASNATGSAETAAAVITMLPDTVPPGVRSLSASIFASRLRMTVSEPLDDLVSQVPTNYSVPGRTVTGVTKISDFLYDISIDPAPAAGESLTLNISGVKDEAGNSFAPPSAQTTAPSGFPVMPRLIAAFHGGSAVTHPLDGVTWNDLSGNGNHAVSRGTADTTALRRPTLVSAGLNGRNTFAFSRTNQQFLAIDGAQSTGLNGTDYTFFLVAKQASAVTSGYFPNLIRHASDFSAANWGAYFFAGNAATSSQPAMVISARNGGGGEVPCFVTPVSFGSWSILSGQVNGAAGESSGRLEARDTFPASVTTGSATGSLNMGTTPVATFIGRSAGANVANESFDGEMAEVLIYSGALTAAEQAAVELYLRCRYFGPDHADIAILPQANGDVEITFAGALQRSVNLQQWTTLNVTSPHVIPAASRLTAEFFRSACP